MAEWIVEIGDGNPHIKKMIPLVRCKDCKHRKNGGLHRSEKDGWTVVYDVPCNLGDDGFCSRGEKVTE